MKEEENRIEEDVIEEEEMEEEMGELIFEEIEWKGITHKDLNQLIDSEKKKNKKNCLSSTIQSFSFHFRSFVLLIFIYF